MSTLLSLFPQPAKPPTAPIAGLRLTHDQTQRLLALSATISQILTQQTGLIAQLVQITTTKTTTTTTATIPTLLSTLQTRHSRLLTNITYLTARLTPSPPTSWLREIEDANVAMGQKVKMCNHASRQSRLGSSKAATRYWPMIGDTYKILEGLVGRLKGDCEDMLGDEGVWGMASAGGEGKKWMLWGFGRARTREDDGNGNARGDKRRSVSFDKQVKGRRSFEAKTGGDAVASGEDGAGKEVYKEFTASLASDKKRTAGSFRSRGQTRSQSVGSRGDAERRKGIDKEDEEQIAREVFKGEYAPVPL